MATAFNSTLERTRFVDTDARSFDGSRRVEAWVLFIATCILSIVVTMLGLGSKPDHLGSDLLKALSSDKKVRSSYYPEIALQPVKLSPAKKASVLQQVKFVSDIIQGHTPTARKDLDLAFSIVFESIRAGYDPLLVAAVIKSESNFYSRAISPKGAQGLMQILPATGKYISDANDLRWHGNNKLMDPDYNIRLGIAYLKYLENVFGGNRELALIAYNWGPARLVKAIKSRSHIPSSTVKYARTIMNDHKRWMRSWDIKAAA